MKTKITKAEFDDLGADEQAKYQANPDNAEEYLLVKPAKQTTAPEDTELTAAQKAVIAKQLKDATTEAVNQAKAEWELAKKEAEAKEQGKFQELYEGLQAKHTELEAEVVKLREIVDAEIEAKAATLGDDLKPLYELVSEDREARLKWLSKASALPAKLGDAVPLPPKPGTKEFEAVVAEITEQRVNSGVYSF
jgi:hypothetical protein